MNKEKHRNLLLKPSKVQTLNSNNNLVPPGEIGYVDYTKPSGSVKS